MPKKIGWPARAALEMVTITAARSLGSAKEIGSLTPGKRADLVVLTPDQVRGGEVVDPTNALLFFTDVADVRTVLVAGRVRKQNGHLVGVDFAELHRATADAIARVDRRYAALPRERFDQVWAGMF